MDRSQVRYAKTDEWVSLDGDIATVGISDKAVAALTDLVYLTLPQVGQTFRAASQFGEVESVKAASDLYAPVAGTVVEVNSQLPEKLDWFKEDPYGKAWILKLKVEPGTTLDHLMDAAAYEEHWNSNAH